VRVAPIVARCAGLGLKNHPPLIVDAHHVNSERNLSRWIERLAALKVESREVQRAGHRRAINGGGREEATIELAILVGADAVDRQQLAAAIYHQDGHATRPSKAHCAVGELDCGEEALSGHAVWLGGECGRLLRQRSVKLCCKHIAQALCVGIERECSNDGLKESHHNRAARLGIGQPA
jgi:hypothetical protein